MGDLNKYKSVKSTNISISFVTPMRDLDKFKSVISTSICIANSDIYYCIFVTVICLLLN